MEPGQFGLNCRKRRQGNFQGQHVPRIGDAEGHAAAEAGDVLDGSQCRSEADPRIDAVA